MKKIRLVEKNDKWYVEEVEVVYVKDETKNIWDWQEKIITVRKRLATWLEIAKWKAGYHWLIEFDIPAYVGKKKEL